MTYRNPRESLIDMVYSMLGEKMVRTTKKAAKRISQRKTPATTEEISY